MWMLVALLCTAFVANILHLRNKLDVGGWRQNLFYPLIMLYCILLNDHMTDDIWSFQLQEI